MKEKRGERDIVKEKREGYSEGEERKSVVYVVYVCAIQ